MLGYGCRYNFAMSNTSDKIFVVQLRENIIPRQEIRSMTSFSANQQIDNKETANL